MKGKKTEKPKNGSRKDGDTQIRYRFYRTMKPQRVYPLEVEVVNVKAGNGAGTVVVRPLIPGAQVVPSEARLDASAVGNKTRFHVTPLAKGRLKAAHLEVHVLGRDTQSVPLRARAATQRWAWMFLLLAIVLPTFIHAITFGGWRVPDKTEKVAFFVDTAPRDAVDDDDDDDGQEQPDGNQPDVKRMPDADGRAASDGKQAEPEQGDNDQAQPNVNPPNVNAPIGIGFPNLPPVPDGPNRTLHKTVTIESHVRVERGVQQWFQDEFAKDQLLVTKKWRKMPGRTKDFTLAHSVSKASGWGYKWLVRLVDENSLCLILPLVLLVLAMLSWSLQRAHRSKRKATLTLAPAIAAAKQEPALLRAL